MLNRDQVFSKNHDYQRDLAKSLIESLGYEGAIQVCYENQWYGVLTAVGRENRKMH